MKIFLLLLFVVFTASALVYVDCAVDCDVTPDIGAVVQQCLIDQATVCGEYKVLIVDYDGLTDPLNQAAKRVSCDDVGPSEFTVETGGPNQPLCIQTTRCYIDPDAVVRVKLNGTCDPTTLNIEEEVFSIDYMGPATFVGPGMSCGSTPVRFTSIVFDGNGTTEPLFTCCMTLPLKMINCTITGFNGIESRANGYLARVESDRNFMDAERGWSLRDISCADCTYDGWNLIYWMMSQLSDCEWEIIDGETIN
jgi:hypothetical protein